MANLCVVFDRLPPKASSPKDFASLDNIVEAGEIGTVTSATWLEVSLACCKLGNRGSDLVGSGTGLHSARTKAPFCSWTAGRVGPFVMRKEENSREYICQGKVARIVHPHLPEVRDSLYRGRSLRASVRCEPRLP